MSEYIVIIAEVVFRVPMCALEEMMAVVAFLSLRAAIGVTRGVDSAGRGIEPPGPMSTATAAEPPEFKPLASSQQRATAQRPSHEAL